MKIEDIKKIGIKNLVLVLIAGLLLLMCTLPGKIYDKNAGSEKINETKNIPSVTPAPDDEMRLQQLLSKVEGTGKTDVMIMYSTEIETKIEGVVVVTEGASKSYVVQYISDAVEALFGIPKHKIIVLPMKQKTEADERT